MRHNIIVRLIVYYLATLAAVAVLLYTVPQVGAYMAAERARQGGRAAIELDHGAQAQELLSPSEAAAAFLDPERTVPIVVSIAIALAVALPVVWVYQWTRPRRRYNQTFAQTLLVVPIAITLVVFLVKGSLALAFSLAGIVAAVRFRTTLDEPIDAVYLFIVIGTGLAAGVQLLFVAFIASVIFNAVVLAVWRLNLGGQPTALHGWQLVPAVAAESLAPAGAALAPSSPATDEPAERFNSRLRLHVTNVEEGKRLAVPVVEERAKAWQLTEIAQEPDGANVIEFDLRLKKSVDLAAFVKDLEKGNPYVVRVELTKIKAKQTEP